MGIMDFLRRSRGALDDDGRAEDYFTPENVEARNQASGLTNTAPFVPTNPVEARLAQRTMNEIVPARPAGMQPPEMGIGAPVATPAEYGQYVSPRQAYRNQVQAALAERMQYQQAELDRKMNNPFFKVTDLIADVGRNTIGLPFNMVTGNQAFTYDPDNDARTATRRRLETLEDLQFQNNNMYMDSLEARGVAMEDATNARRQTDINAITASTGQRLYNKYDTGKFTLASQQAHRDHFERTGEDKPSLLVRNPTTSIKQDVNGRLMEVRTNDDGSETVIRYLDDMGDMLTDRAAINDFDSWQTAKDKWLTVADSSITAMASRQRKTDTVNAAIEKAMEIIDGAAGFAGLWKDLPASDANALRGYLTTIQSNIGFQELRDMKASGATLGQIAVAELGFLQSIMGDLSQNQAVEVLRNNLIDVRNNYAAADASFVEQMNRNIEMFGTRQSPRGNPFAGGGAQPTPAATPSAANNDPNLNILDD
jgi:hypothetical protein